MVHTGPLFTVVAHKTRYVSIQRSLNQAKSKNNNIRDNTSQEKKSKTKMGQ